MYPIAPPGPIIANTENRMYENNQWLLHFLFFKKAKIESFIYEAMLVGGNEKKFPFDTITRFE